MSLKFCTFTIKIKQSILGDIMSKATMKRSKFKTQRALGVELPGLGRPGALKNRQYGPGQHGQRRSKKSEYAIRLNEKQKVRFHYGLREEQLLRLIKRSKKEGGDNWAGYLIEQLECRLDNVVFRLGLVSSIPAAKQLISHGFVLVNGKKCDISSRILEPGDKVSLHDKAKKFTFIQASIKKPRLPLPHFLTLDQDPEILGTLVKSPLAGDVPFEFEIQYFIEFYGRVK